MHPRSSALPTPRPRTCKGVFLLRCCAAYEDFGLLSPSALANRDAGEAPRIPEPAVECPTDDSRPNPAAVTMACAPDAERSAERPRDDWRLLWLEVAR